MATSQEIFASFVASFDGRNAAAKALGCSYVLVSHILTGERAVSKEIAEKVELLSRGTIAKERALWGDDAKPRREAA